MRTVIARVGPLGGACLIYKMALTALRGPVLRGATLDDHAVGGATSGATSIVPQLVPALARFAGTGLLTQIDEAQARHERYTAADLVIVWAGSNDLFGVARADRAVLDKRIADAAQHIDQALERLAVLGATRMVVANRPPRDIIGSDNDLSGVELNRALAAAVQRARATTHADIRLFDAYSAVAEMMTAPSKYGFVDTQAACIAAAACAGESFDQGLALANTYINWDNTHKTTRVHRLMADQLVRILR